MGKKIPKRNKTTTVKNVCFECMREKLRTSTMKSSDRVVLLYITVFKIANIALIVFWIIPYINNYKETWEKEFLTEGFIKEDESEEVRIASLGSHRRGLPRKLLSDGEKDIIYAPGHEPNSTSGNEKGYNLTKVRRYDVDTFQEGVAYIIIGSSTSIFGLMVFLLIFVHTWKLRYTIAQEAYDLVYPVSLRKRLHEIPDFRGITNLYMNGKIVSIMWIFAFFQMIYQTLVLLCPLYLPNWLVCTPDPAWIALVHLPVNMIAVAILFLAIFNSDYHAVMIHSVITMYATMYFCMVLFGLASTHETLCMQTIATQIMFTLSAWVFCWPPKIAGLASLRDRLAYEKMILKEYDKVELMRMREVTGSYKECEYPSSSCSSGSEDIEQHVVVSL